MEYLTIGRLARRAGVHIETVRYYQRRGLLAEPPRSLSNYRLYPEDTVRRVRFIKRAQELGFSLREIEELLSLRAAPRARCAEVRRRAEAKTEAIEEKIRALKSMRRALGKLIAECSGRGPATECPILEALDPRPGKRMPEAGRDAGDTTIRRHEGGRVS
jgi:MerR family mercuric resistance operon transcriptional regulator